MASSAAIEFADTQERKLDSDFRYREAPPFSPSQVPSKERVLHSIFSPSYRPNERLRKQVNFDLAESKHVVKENGTNTPTRMATRSVEKEFFHTPKQVINLKYDRRREGTEYGEFYFSPLTETNQSQISEISDLSEQENTDDAKVQGEILHKINTPGTAKGIDICEDDYSPGNVFFNGCTANISRITNGNTTLDSIDPSKSTLNFSLSPQSQLMGTKLVDAPFIEVADSEKLLFPDTGTRSDSIAETSARKSLLNDNQKLSEEVKELSLVAMDLDTSRISQHESFIQKLEDLENAKRDAEELVKNLSTKVEKADSEKKDLIERMQKLQKEQKKTQQDLERQRLKIRTKHDEARAVETRLMIKISELTEALAQERENSRLVIGAEKGLRLRRERELSEQNRSLQEIRSNLETMKNNHLHFRMELLKAIGVNDFELRELSQDHFAASLSQKLKAMKEEHLSITKALKEREEQETVIAGDRERIDRLLKDTTKSKVRLEEENMKLSKKIQDLAEEMASSRAYIDKLLSTTHDTQQSNWENKEQQYKAIIRNLRHQVRKQTTSVSINLYKAAVHETRKKQEDLKSAELKIATLKSKITLLEKQSEERRFSFSTGTPGNKFAERKQLMSPTDFLEKGLLSKGYLYDGISSPLNNVYKTPSRTDLELPHRAFTPSAKKKQWSGEKQDKSSDISLSIHKSLKARNHSGVTGTKRENLTPKQLGNSPKQRENLTGMMISFQKEPVHDKKHAMELSQISHHHSSLLSLENTKDGSGDVLEWVDNYTKANRTQNFNDGQTKRNQEFKQVIEVRTPQSHDSSLLKNINHSTKKIAIDLDTQQSKKDSENKVTSEVMHDDKGTNSTSAPSVGRSSNHQDNSETGGNPTSSRKSLNQKENFNPKTPKSSSSNPKTPKSSLRNPKTPKSSSSNPKTPKSSSRMQMIREHGGRKALMDKLKKLRSPPLRAKTLSFGPVQVN